MLNAVQISNQQNSKFSRPKITPDLGPRLLSLCGFAMWWFAFPPPASLAFPMRYRNLLAVRACIFACFAPLSLVALSACVAQQAPQQPSQHPKQQSSLQATAASGDAQPSIAPTFQNLDLLSQFAKTNRFRTGRPSNFTWLPDSSAVLYTRARSDTDRTQDLFAMRTDNPIEFRCLSTDDILGGQTEQLSAEEAARRERMRLSARGIARFSLSPDGKLMLVPLSGSVFVVDVARAMNAQPQQSPLRIEDAIDAKFSPDSSHVAFVRKGEVFVRSLTEANATDQQVSRGATVATGGTISNGEAEFVAQEEMDRTEGFWWSPNSNAIVYQQNDTKDVQTFTIADAANPASEPQAFPYPRAGKPNVQVSLWHAWLPNPRADNRPPARIEWNNAKYPYLARVAWGKASDKTTTPSHLHILVQNRLQREQVLLAADLETYSTTAAETIATRSVLTERDPAWLNLHAFDPQWIKAADALWWMTENNSGFSPQLLSPTGTVLAKLADDALPIGGARTVLATSNDARTLWVAAGTTPTRTTTFRIDAAQSSQGAWSLRCSPAFAPQNSNSFQTLVASPDASSGVVFHHEHGVVSSTSVAKLSAKTLTKIAEIPSVAATPIVPLNVELATVSDAKHSFECAIIRPSFFTKGTKYPVLNFVYAGPGVTIVSADTRRYALEQWYAQQGYIVVSIEGRGTPHKGREWERVIAGNLIDVAMQDQCDALELLSKKYPEMDASRIGVYGWSFGGYFGLLAPTLRPDVFKAAAAGAPVADWQDYDTHYTERFMGLPAALAEKDTSASDVDGGINTQGYEASSALTHASKLASPLLILHGTADDNVYFTHSIRMADALTRAGKNYEFIPLMSQTHGVASPLLIERMHQQIASFFKRNLPPATQ